MEAVGETGSLDLSRERPLEEVAEGYTFMRDGDVVFAKITPCFENGKGAVIEYARNGIAFGTTELTVLRPRAGASLPRYLFYLLSTSTFRQVGEASMYGAGGQKRVPDSVARDTHIALPPLEDQRAIAAFLDRETAKIDALVAEQRRLVDLLQEKRQAVITRAVTKGLDPDVPMKDSGVEWLGEVPAHWTVARLSRFARVENGSTPAREVLEYWNEGTVPWVSSGEVSQGRITMPTEWISERALAECSLRLLPRGSVIVGLIGQGKTRGSVALLEIEACINQNIAAILCKEGLEGEYLFFAFQPAYDYLRELGRGGNQAALNCEILSGFSVPVPPVAEQRQIVEWLERSDEAINSLLETSGLAIDLLMERRAALITAAVTGQIDVRGLAATEAA